MDSKDPSSREITILPDGDTCDKCGSTKRVRMFNGSYLCKSCRNQWAEII